MDVDTETVDVISLLLRPDAPNVAKRRGTAKFEARRLSKLFDAPFIVEVRGLSYDKYAAVREDSAGDIDVALAGLVSPDLRDSRLLEHYGAPTPEELIKMIFLPGEISEIARNIEKLTGFRQVMLREVKKN